MQEQVLRDVALVWLDCGQLPEVLTLILHPKGNLEVASVLDLRSSLGWVQWQASWRVVELWTVTAADLLATNDVGLIPWVPLTNFTQPPETILQACRERLDRDAAPDEHANLLAVAQVLTSLRYNDPQLLAIFGGPQAMIESPLLNQLLSQRSHRVILRFLAARFGPVPEDLAAQVQAITDEQRLDALTEGAALCRDLEEFRGRLQ